MLEFDKNLPIYWQICEYIKNLVFTGEIKPGDLAPSIRNLAVEINVNPNTVQRSYLDLEREGVLIPQRGVGAAVTTDLEKIKQLKHEKIKRSIESLYTQLIKLGMNNDEILEEIANYLREWGVKK